MNLNKRTGILNTFVHRGFQYKLSQQSRYQYETRICLLLDAEIKELSSRLLKDLRKDYPFLTVKQVNDDKTEVEFEKIVTGSESAHELAKSLIERIHGFIEKNSDRVTFERDCDEAPDSNYISPV